MRFSDVIGQGEVKQLIGCMLQENRLPHALLFDGPEGSGKLAMALALAQRLLCQHPTPEGEPCGECQGCRMASALAHPDLHFTYPVFKPKGSQTPPDSTLFIDEWREMVADSPYFSRQEWMQHIGVENQQALINVSEANRLIQELSKVSSQNGYRVVVIWEADLMNTQTANKMLKILEEPPERTVFILTTAHSERLLSTILSRTQRIEFPPIAADDLARALMAQSGLDEADARTLARASAGSYIRARQQLTNDAEHAQFFDLFVLFMRLCYMRRVKDLNEWSMQLSSWGRERQKAFLEYAQKLVRENFIYNFHEPELNYMTKSEQGFAVNFARFINERNVIPIAQELERAQRDIEANVNARMVFFDFSLQMIVLLKQ